MSALRCGALGVPSKRYLGDSVYAEVDLERRMIKLTTENDSRVGPSNTIYLEPEVYSALVQFVSDATAVGEESEEQP